MNSIDKTLEYHELLMTLDDINSVNLNTLLPSGFKYTFYNGEDDMISWAKIHISSGEFTSYNKAFEYFDLFYKGFIEQLDKRCFFIEYDGKKVATATVSLGDEFGYTTLIDWLAIDKEYQGKGLAKPLIYKCLEIAKNLGDNKILLHTQTHTWLAAKLYLDIGFNPLIVEDTRGWDILKTITNHYKLDSFSTLKDSDIYDTLTKNVITVLNNIHKEYEYEVWYKDDLNDVYVRENDEFFHYKFFNNGKKLELIDRYSDDI